MDCYTFNILAAVLSSLLQVFFFFFFSFFFFVCLFFVILVNLLWILNLTLLSQNVVSLATKMNIIQITWKKKLVYTCIINSLVADYLSLVKENSTLNLENNLFWGSSWCNGYRRRKWTQRHEFKSWTRLIAFHIALIPLGKVWI